LVARRKLLSPGPIEVHPDLLREMSVPMFSHRSADYHALHARVREKLRRLLLTRSHVFLLTSSGTGAMEAAMRNCVARRVLTCAVGAFGERWHQIAVGNGIESELLSVEWGRGLRPEQIEERLRGGGIDAVAVTHNETSTGVMNRLEEIGSVVRRFPDVLLMADCVSSLAGARVEPDAWGVDVVLAGVQKAFGLPPGLAVMVVGERAMKRAETIRRRGFYFDLVKFRDADAKDETPETPALSLVWALDKMLDRALAEGVEARFERTRRMQQQCHAWARQRFGLFAEEGYRSVTMTCVANPRGVDLKKMLAAVGERGFTIAEGYGKLRDQTFRIAHMGDITEADLKALTEAIDSVT
jgi:aspartate aminotransferase-like enzyme